MRTMVPVSLWLWQGHHVDPHGHMHMGLGNLWGYVFLKGAWNPKWIETTILVRYCATCAFWVNIHQHCRQLYPKNNSLSAKSAETGPKLEEKILRDMFSRFVSCCVDICLRGWMLIEWMHLQLPQCSWLSVVSARLVFTTTKLWTTQRFGFPIPHVWSVILWIRVNFLYKTQGGSVDFGRLHMVVRMRMWPSTAPCGFNQASNVILKRFGARCTITEKTDCKLMGFVTARRPPLRKRSAWLVVSKGFDTFTSEMIQFDLPCFFNGWFNQTKITT